MAKGLEAGVGMGKEGSLEERASVPMQEWLSTLISH